MGQRGGGGEKYKKRKSKHKRDRESERLKEGARLCARIREKEYGNVTGK